MSGDYRSERTRFSSVLVQYILMGRLYSLDFRVIY